jgi:hypothetical protein
VAVDAFLSEMMAESADPDTGSTHDDLRAVLVGLMHFYTGTKRLAAGSVRPSKPVLWERADPPPRWTPPVAAHGHRERA